MLLSVCRRGLRSVCNDAFSACGGASNLTLRSRSTLPSVLQRVKLEPWTIHDARELAALDFATFQNDQHQRAWWPARLRQVTRSDEVRIDKLAGEIRDNIDIEKPAVRLKACVNDRIVGWITATIWKNPSPSEDTAEESDEEPSGLTTAAALLGVTSTVEHNGPTVIARPSNETLDIPDLPKEHYLSDPECDQDVAKVCIFLWLVHSINHFGQKERWDIDGLAVLPEFQRQGIGSVLLQECLSRISVKYPGMTVAVMAGGADAEVFYRKHSFTRFNEINVTTSYDEHGNAAETKYVWPLLELKPARIEPAELEVS